jgi:hypothetical protein
MIELTDDQRRELSEPEPTAVDQHTRAEYVLVRKEAYQRKKALFVDGTAYATGELVDGVMAEDDANDTHLAEYQRLYGGRP